MRGARESAFTAAVTRACVMSVALAVLVGCDAPPAGGDDDPGVDGSPSPSPADARLPPIGASYGEDGPTPYDTAVEQVTNAGSTFTVTAYIPSTPGPHPAVSLSCGSTQTAAGYLPYARRLASHGIAMFITDDAGVFTNTSDIVPNAVYLVETWIPSRYAGVIDLARIGLAGHSRGGAVSLLAAEHGLSGKVVAWFGLDPVDNQFLMNPRDWARDDLAAIGIPTGWLGAEVTSNCAPTADSYPTLYPLAPAPKVLIVGIGAGHTQLETPDGCSNCSLCSPDGTAPDDVVLAYSVRYFAAFFARELLGDTAVGAHFEGAGGPEDVAAGLVTIE